MESTVSTNVASTAGQNPIKTVRFYFTKHILASLCSIFCLRLWPFSWKEIESGQRHLKSMMWQAKHFRFSSKNLMQRLIPELGRGFNTFWAGKKSSLRSSYNGKPVCIHETINIEPWPRADHKSNHIFARDFSLGGVLDFKLDKKWIF